jgi:hypothetical protein
MSVVSSGTAPVASRWSWPVARSSVVAAGVPSPLATAPAIVADFAAPPLVQLRTTLAVSGVLARVKSKVAAAPSPVPSVSPATTVSRLDSRTEPGRIGALSSVPSSLATPVPTSATSAANGGLPACVAEASTTRTT